MSFKVFAAIKSQYVLMYQVTCLAKGPPFRVGQVHN